MILKAFVDEIKIALPYDFKHIDNRLIIQVINESRAVWLKNQFNQGRSIDDVVRQTIYVDLEMVNRIDYPFITDTHKILRSKVIIPKTINQHNIDSIISVRNGDILTENYNYVTKDAAVYSGNSYTNKKAIFVFNYKGKFHVKLNKANSKINLLNKLAIEGVFEDPREAYLINNTGDVMFMDYPLPITVFTYNKENIINSLTQAVKSEITEKQTDD